MIKNLLCASVLLMFVGVNAQTNVFLEDFENSASVANWTIVDRDGDNQNWEILNAEANELTTFAGNFAISFSWYWEAFTPDNLLISPKITLPSENFNTLTFKVGSGDDELFFEKYAVYAIPANEAFTGDETPIFQEVLDASYLEQGKTVSVDLSEFNGQDIQLVFRHFESDDIFYIGLDDVKVDNNLLSVNDISKASVTLYPNPTSDFVKINGLAKVDRIRIFDMQGRIVKETTSQEIDVKSLAKGQYLINVYSANSVITKKLIKN